MKNKIIVIISIVVIILFITYSIGIKYIGYKIVVNDKKFFSEWQHKEFFYNEYIVVVWNFYRPNNIEFPAQDYLEVDYLSSKQDIRFDNLIIKNIYLIKKGDTLIKPKKTYDIYLIRDKKKEKIYYQWSWE